MKITKTDIEHYRRSAFHHIDKFCDEKQVQLFRSSHFIERLNLRATDQREAVKTFAYAVKRAMTAPNGKVSINVQGHTFLFVVGDYTGGRKDDQYTKTINCATYVYLLPHDEVQHFADADTKIKLVKR